MSTQRWHLPPRDWIKVYEQAGTAPRIFRMLHEAANFFRYL
jgi:hypothetical protein